jgi:hypothetical protein
MILGNVRLRRPSSAWTTLCLCLGACVLAARPASGTVSIGAWMLSSPNDLSGFTTLSGNDSTANATLPFTLTIDGTGYTTVAISTNGWLEFGGNTSGNSDPTNDCLPTPAHTNPFLAAYWDDLQTFGNNVRYGTVGTSPNRTFIVDYDGVDVDPAVEGGGADDLRLQVEIHEGSNLINVRYHDTGSAATGTGATIGWQGAGGSGASAQPISCNARVLDDNRPNEGWSADVGRAGLTTLTATIEESPDDISGFTTLSGNDSTASVGLGFSVSLEGASYSTVAISTNGWVELGGNTSGNSDSANGCLPVSNHTNPLIAVYWDDMQTQGNAIRYGTIGTSPNRVFVVDWQMDVVAQGGSDIINAQLQIHEGSNLIHVRYRDGGNSNANGQAATIGFQGAGGSSASAYPITCNGKVMDDNQSDESWSVHPKPLGAMSLHAIMAHSPDDISGFTSLSGDNATASASMPFNVRIDGVNYGTVGISTNGWLEFGGNTSGTSDPSNVALPTSSHSNPFLAAYWDDLQTEGNNVRYGTVGTSPNRTFIVDYEAFIVPSPDSGADGIQFQVEIHETSNVISVKYRTDQFYTNGQTATIGFQGAGGASATAYPLVLNGKILDDDRQTAGWSVAPLPICGNSIVETRESCDLGGANGSSTSCCTSVCAFRTSGSTCRSAAGVCDVAETCTGGSGTCPGDGFVSSATVCRSSAGGCDVAENCTGSSAPCPADTIRPSGFVCRSAAGVCDVAESCDGVATACPADGLQSSSTVCRSAAGVCDVAENCTGSGASCPADVFQSSAIVCRSSAGVCDVAESCTGSGPSCPADGFVTSGTVCRSAAGVCDVAESCTGGSASCPSDQVQPNGATCRSSAGVCDVADVCDGVATTCPADGKQSSGTVCRSSAGTCDVTEVCDGVSDTCPADGFASSSVQCRSSAGVCDVAENCTGSGADCPSDVFEPSSVVCRSAAGVCDVAENCTGSSASCPGDAKQSSGSLCRASAGTCDVTEACDGVSDDCPADGYTASGVECRASAGLCDVAESCEGSGPDCPADALASSSVVCRAASDVCDVAENCTGSDANCPADAFASSTVECRATAGPCDVAENCTGSGAACPADAFESSATVCRSVAGACDVAENCTGSGAACPADSVSGAFVVCRSAVDVCDTDELCDGVGTGCPADAKQATSSVCRPSGGPCDVADTCDGIGDACPADQKEASGTVCRSAAGVCDLQEVCNGASDLCPSDVKKSSGTVCRSAAGVCDVAESCTGSGDACPADAFAPASTVCRSVAGACDVAETCTGSGASCPADTGSPDGDGDGTCDVQDDCPLVADPGQADGDNDGLGDACDPCNNTFNGGAFATKSKIIVTKLVSAPGDDKFKLKGFLLLPQTPAVRCDLNGMRLLLQKQDGSYVFDATLPPGAYDLVQKVGWRVNGSTTKFSYKNSGTPTPLIDGIYKASIGLSTKTAGLIKFGVGGKNGAYGPLTGADLPLKATLILDVPPHESTSQCGETNYAPANCLLVPSGSTVKCQLK